MRTRRILWSGCMVSVLSHAAGAVCAQAPARATFDVASVKPAGRELLLQQGFNCGLRPGGTFMAFGPLKWLIGCAYGIRAARAEQEMLNAPQWFGVDLFEIVAKTAPRTGPDAQSEGFAMLRSLLEERFKLAVHRETRDVPMYALVIARRDRRLGPQLRPTGEDCLVWLAGGRRGQPPPVSGDLPCGRQMAGTATAIRATAMPVSQLATLLSPRVERPVRDQTGLIGSYVIDLQWRSEQGPQQTGLDERLPTSVFTALQEQLGLKLEPTKGSLDVLVIDHVEHPTPD